MTTPANIVVGNDAATVTYADATASDLVDGPLSATCAPASGTRFPLGTTTVTCAATDAAGNKGTHSFTVTVQDATKPVVSVPTDKTVEATGADGATVSYSAATAQDDVDGALAPTCTPGSGGVLPPRHDRGDLHGQGRGRQRRQQLLHGQGRGHHGSDGPRPG